MNALPIVFAFILIFSILCTGFIRELRQSTISHTLLLKFNKIDRAATNAIAQKHYQRIHQEKTENKGNQKAPSKTLAFCSHREGFPPLDSSKLNLSSLFALQTDPKNHPLYEICAELLRFLYQDVLFKDAKQEDLEYVLLDELLKRGGGSNEAKTVLDLYPEDPHLKALFYQMLKGTNQYDVARHCGVPPFEDFFCLNKAPAVHFAFASPPLLEAVFGKAHTLQILAEEKKKWQANGQKVGLSQNELSALLSNDPMQSSFVLNLGPHLNFSQKPAKRTVLARKDAKSGVSVKKQID